jgi:20S proteasome alpha/beta subunit
LALLREDHIIFASDSRHIRGDQEGRYKNDDAFKVETILGDRALLGFAGTDQVEEVVARVKRRGKLTTGSLQDAAAAVEAQIRELYGNDIQQGRGPLMEFIIAGFEVEGERKIASCITIGGRLFNRLPRSYDPKYDNFDIIGYKKHGAFYVLRKCAKDCLTVELGTRLACFTLIEVSKYETMVGGAPQIYVIRPGREVENISDKLDPQEKWAADVGERIRTMIVTP